jgi:hypothetical protein
MSREFVTICVNILTRDYCRCGYDVFIEVCLLVLQLQELEMENAKLKTDLASLRKVTADGESGGQELLSKSAV